MKITEALNHLVSRSDLSREQMHQVMKQVMTGEASDAQIGGLLVALRMKGEVRDEIAGAAEAMRSLATPVDVNAKHLVDTCGTGGDGANLFNVSTASAFVCAAAGASVAKHGNRSVSSSTGSADVLEAAGVNLNASADLVARAVEEIGLGFMFAPAHHGAMKHAIGPRRQLAMRTIFNMLGPITNPAGVKRQVLGVYDKSLCRLMAEVLQQLGSEHVMVVHSDDGLDEISPVAKTWVAELKNGGIDEYYLDPEELGCKHTDLSGLSVASAKESLDLIRSVFSSKPGFEKATDIITLNAGAAIFVSGVAASFKEGVALAEDAIASGGAKEKIKELAEFTALAGD